MKSHSTTGSWSTGRFAGRYRLADADDSADSAAAKAEAALRANFGVDDSPVGDTAAQLRDETQAGEANSADIFQVLNESVDAAPQRGDLWMMRFETLRALGLKADFADYLKQAWRDPVVRGRLEPAALARMWRELAGDEPAPEGVLLPRLPALAAVLPAGEDEPDHDRRFADMALRIAGADIAELVASYNRLRSVPGFFQAFARRVGPMLRRPTRLHLSAALSARYGSAARIYLKREDLRHVTPETENATAQAYLAEQLGRKVLVASDEVESHCLELAAVAPRFALQCLIVARPETLEGKSDFLACLRSLGARVESSAGLPLESTDPREAALWMWRQAPQERHLAPSLAGGPSPYPAMLSDFQSLMGQETQLQLRAHCSADRPRTIVAAVHSAADSVGFMLPQLAGTEADLVYTEPRAGGTEPWYPMGRLAAYNGAQRIHAALRRTGRLTYAPVADGDAYEAQRDALRLENMSLTLEDSRALAFAGMVAAASPAPRDIVVLVA